MKAAGIIVILFLAMCLPFIADSTEDRTIKRKKPTETSERRTALVIGNSKYTDSPLKNPVNDAADVAGALENLGFDVIHKENANKKTMKDAIRDFEKKLRSSGVGLFYFAGHGMQVNGKNYLIPTDAQIETEADVEDAAVEANWLLGKMQDAGSHINIIILDACRNNPVARSFRSASTGLAEMKAPKGAVIAYATGPGEVAADGIGRNGTYTKYLLKYLREPGLEIAQFFKKVGKDVAEETGEKQTPWMQSKFYGDFYFSEEKPPPPTPAPTATPAPPGNQDKGQWREATTGMEFVYVKGGCFQMGSPDSEKDHQSDEGAVHEVCVDAFWMGKNEVTVGQWREFVKDTDYKSEAETGGGAYSWTGKEWKKTEGTYWDNPGFSQTDSHPVTCISWNDAVKYAKWLSGKRNNDFRLPSEAEWEYACRAGTKTARFWGDDADKACIYANVADKKAKQQFSDWTIHNCDDGYVNTAPVGSYKANAFGLNDMLGNVWEWCLDIYDSSSYSERGRKNPVYAGTGSDIYADKSALRVIRGGSWDNKPAVIRCAYRSDYSPGFRSSDLGFRLLRKP